METRELIKRIAQNDSDAMVELAKELLLGETKVSIFKPIPLLKRAALQGNEEARNLLFALGEDPNAVLQQQPSTDTSDIVQSVIIEDSKEFKSNDFPVTDKVGDEDCGVDNEETDINDTVDDSEDGEKECGEGDDEIYWEDSLKPYESKLLKARLLYNNGQKEQAYKLMEECVDVCPEEDFTEENALLQDTLLNLAAYYMDSDKVRYERYVRLGARIGEPVLQFTAGKDILLKHENDPELVMEGISFLQKSIASGKESVAIRARVALLSFFLAPKVKGYYRKNFKLIAQYFIDIFNGKGNDDTMANILLGDFLSRMSNSDLASLPDFAGKVGLPASNNPKKLAIKAYLQTIKLATQCKDANERALAVLAMQHIEEIKAK